MAYWASDGKSERVVRDGVAEKAYDEIGKPLFGPDGKHLAYDARGGGDWRLVVDGVEGPQFIPIRGFNVERDWRQRYRNGWTFAGADRLFYVGVKDGEIVRWDVQFAPTAP